MLNPNDTQEMVLAARLPDLKSNACLAVNINGHPLALFSVGSQVYAVDNRCPHMGFPLHRGSVKDGILTCHWHHARFDLASGGTFDQWADDVPVYPVEVRGEEIYVDLQAKPDVVSHQQKRLRDGLERNISLVVAKSVIQLLNNGVSPADPFRTGLDFGVHYRMGGWGQGLTMHTCFMNILPHLDPEDRSRALFHGISAVANDSEGSAPRFMVRALPASATDIPTSNAGSVNLLKCATRKALNDASSLPWKTGQIHIRWQTCSFRLQLTTVISPPGIPWTSRTKPWKPWIPLDGNMPRPC